MTRVRDGLGTGQPLAVLCDAVRISDQLPAVVVVACEGGFAAVKVVGIESARYLGWMALEDRFS